MSRSEADRETGDKQAVGGGGRRRRPRSGRGPRRQEGHDSQLPLGEAAPQERPEAPVQQETSEKPVVLADPKISDSAGAGSQPQAPGDGDNELAAEERAAGPRSEWPKEDTTGSASSDREPEPPGQAQAPKPSRGAHPLARNGGRGGRSPVWRPHSQAGHPLAAPRPRTPPESGGHGRDEIESPPPTEAPGRAQPPSGEPDAGHPRREVSAGRSQHPFERADSSVALEASDSSARGVGAKARQPVEPNRPPVSPGASESSGLREERPESHPGDAPPEERSTEAGSAIPTTPRAPCSIGGRGRLAWKLAGLNAAIHHGPLRGEQDGPEAGARDDRP